MTDFNTISILDLSYDGAEIDSTVVNNIEYNYGIEGYADKIEIEAKNVANKQKNATMYDVVVPKTEEAILTVDNCNVILSGKHI